MALPTLPPLLISPAATAPPLPDAVATPPLPALAMSVNCAAAVRMPRTAVTAPAKMPFPYFICTCPPQACPSQKDAMFGCERLADERQVVVATARIGDSSAAVGRHPNIGQVGDRTAIHADGAYRVANADGVAGVATAVHVAQGNRATVCARGGHATVAGARDVGDALILSEKVPDQAHVNTPFDSTLLNRPPVAATSNRRIATSPRFIRTLPSFPRAVNARDSPQWSRARYPQRDSNPRSSP